ncbi:regulator of sigma E protease [Bhargavaea ginsengi]|uniref:Zinc metalloprotease n=1 Tax=Bhargavaea ginsengi TaxID=426757 RepID=A0A1H6SYW8_9BACL|nr:RIP metalloprotease RseP [Bhargavaea ginsengi]SEI69145.1 regulator of sigma E protease [Bhargavaea ginsengi]
MQTILAFIVVFGSLVFFHELGHFLLAKRAGIMVREFAIGFGPKLIGINKGETLYTVRLLPLGGYVRMAGEDFDKVELQPGHRIGLLLDREGRAERIVLNQNDRTPDMLYMEVEKADLEKELYIDGYDEEEQRVRYPVSRKAIISEKGAETLIAPYDRQFESKSLGARSATILAGPLFNFILAFFIFVILGLIQGIPQDDPIIADVTDDGPAIAAGIEKGDRIVSVDGREVGSWNAFSAIIQDSPGDELTIGVERAGTVEEVSVTPASIDVEGQTIGQIGVLYEPQYEKNTLGTISYGAEQTWFWFKRIFQLLGMLVTGQFTIEALSGPVGIYQATGAVAQAGIFNLMNWAAVLSINLGIMNLLPLPALDGGRLLFFGFEALRGRPIDKQKEGMVHFVGIMLLMVLMIVVTWNDIQRFFF